MRAATKPMDHILWSELFYYDETSPSCLRWKYDRRTGKDNRILRKAAGDVAGYKSTQVDGYERYVVTVGKGHGTSYLAHRIVMSIAGQKVDGQDVDHIDGNSLNNVVSNLRFADIKTNARNRKKSPRNTSGVTGVSLITCNKTGVPRWYGFVRKTNGKSTCKSFRVDKLGNDAAFRLACEWRNQMMEQLNREGAGYTDDHGKR